MSTSERTAARTRLTEPSSHAERPTGVARPDLRLQASPPSEARVPTGAAALLAPFVETWVGDLPVEVRFWDGSRLGPDDGPGALVVRTKDALRRILWAPGELGIGRAYVAGDLDVEGDLLPVVGALRPAGTRLRQGARALPAALLAAGRLGALGRPLAPPPEEARPRGRRHSKGRDAQAVSHHYDVGNDFYRLVLGEAMTYSCARFVAPTDTLEAAQAAKHELICRKLGLHERPDARLLDVGCGWGSMALHAARHHDARVVGITISREQADLAQRRVDDAGLGDLVEIRLQDYRDLSGEQFDAISSIGMFEHVGKRRMAEYFTTLRASLRPGGRLLNHAISSVGGSRLPKRSFAGRYVFPDGELIDVADVVLALEATGFEVRDVESMREHYAQTLRHWVANLERRWDDAVGLVGEGRARVWLLYMAASSLGFESGDLGLHQVLAVVPGDDGRSDMPATRRDWG
jgi:cyclopropane-fatty-acyl-phospholipid synthase